MKRALILTGLVYAKFSFYKSALLAFFLHHAGDHEAGRAAGAQLDELAGGRGLAEQLAGDLVTEDGDLLVGGDVAALNPAASMAICISCSWNNGTPRVFSSEFRSSGWR